MQEYPKYIEVGKNGQPFIARNLKEEEAGEIINTFALPGEPITTVGQEYPKYVIDPLTGEGETVDNLEQENEVKDRKRRREEEEAELLKMEQEAEKLRAEVAEAEAKKAAEEAAEIERLRNNAELAKATPSGAPKLPKPAGPDKV